jgi:hypothetical protein
MDFTDDSEEKDASILMVGKQDRLGSLKRVTRKVGSVSLKHRFPSTRLNGVIFHKLLLLIYLDGLGNAAFSDSGCMVLSC